MVQRLLNSWRELIRSMLAVFGVIFLFLESYEVLTGNDVTIYLWQFLVLALLPGLIYSLVDGYFFAGFLRHDVKIANPISNDKITVKFGDIFAEDGWKIIGVNDFFDSIVDEELISSKSLHGYVINTYWRENRADWERQISLSLKNIVGKKEARTKGNRLRYPIGTTARACAGEQKFLFVALGKTDASNYVTKANAEMLICAVRGAVSEARAACSMEPLVIPLLGSGLARVGIKDSVLIDLIITAVLEESRQGRVTSEIKIVLPVLKANTINLKNHIRNWTYVK